MATKDQQEKTQALVEMFTKWEQEPLCELICDLVRAHPSILDTIQVERNSGISINTDVRLFTDNEVIQLCEGQAFADWYTGPFDDHIRGEEQCLNDEQILQAFRKLRKR